VVRVVVGGAGVSGLAAAFELQRLGAQVEVLERDAAPGGRAQSLIRDGFAIDPGAHEVSTCDAAADLARAVGLAGELRGVHASQLGAAGVHVLRGRTPLALARQPGIRAVEALRARRLPRLLARYASILPPDAPELGCVLDDRSASEFARLYFGPSVAACWAEPLLASAFLCDASETSRIVLLRGLAAGADGARLRFRRGVGSLVEALARRVPVRCGSEVIGLARGGRSGLSVRCRRAGVEESIECDGVVLAVPAGDLLRAAGGVLQVAERRVLGSAGTHAAIAVALRLELAFEPGALRVRVPRARSAALCAFAWDLGEGGREVPRGGALLSLVARDDWSRPRLRSPDDAVVKELVAELEPLYPALGRCVRGASVFRFQAASPRFEVGRYREIARLRRTEDGLAQEGRRLRFAGDHLVAPSLDGAVRSGLRAARALAADLGLRG
jgi:protoporphyrinogen oxidase